MVTSLQIKVTFVERPFIDQHFQTISPKVKQSNHEVNLCDQQAVHKPLNKQRQLSV